MLRGIKTQHRALRRIKTQRRTLRGIQLQCRSFRKNYTYNRLFDYKIKFFNGVNINNITKYMEKKTNDEYLKKKSIKFNIPESLLL